MDIKVRQGLTLSDQLIDSVQTPDQSHQWPRRLQNDPGAERPHHGGVAAELQRVAEPLFGMQQYGAAADLLAAPLRLIEPALPRSVGDPHTPLVVGPGGGQVAEQQMRNR